jgi:hypothetical protein
MQLRLRFRILFVTLIVSFGMAQPASAQLRVSRATATAAERYPVGTIIPVDRALELRRGDSLTLISLRTGRTYRVSGPKAGTVAAMVGRRWTRDENRAAVRQGLHL